MLRPYTIVFRNPYLIGTLHRVALGTRDPPAQPGSRGIDAKRVRQVLDSQASHAKLRREQDRRDHRSLTLS